MSFTANVVFLIGCISPPTHIICLWRVDVALLADSLQNIALVDGGNKTELLVAPELPTYWYWGMSGALDTSHLPATLLRRSSLTGNTY